MEEIKEIIWTQKFEDDVKKIKHAPLMEKLEKQIKKIVQNPKFGKPLRYDLKGEWAIYVKPYRLIYKVESDKLILLRFEHRKKVYRT